MLSTVGVAWVLAPSADGRASAAHIVATPAPSRVLHPPEPGGPPAHDMSHRMPFLPKLHCQAVPDNDDYWNVQKRKLDMGHVDGTRIDINGGHVEKLLVVESCVPDGFGECDDHRPTAHGRFVGKKEAARCYRLLHDFDTSAMTQAINWQTG